MKKIGRYSVTDMGPPYLIFNESKEVVACLDNVFAARSEAIRLDILQTARESGWEERVDDMPLTDDLLKGQGIRTGLTMDS